MNVLINKVTNKVVGFFQSSAFVGIGLLSLMSGVWFAADYTCRVAKPDEAYIDSEEFAARSQAPKAAPAPPAPKVEEPEILNPVTGLPFRDRPIKLRR